MKAPLPAVCFLLLAALPFGSHAANRCKMDINPVTSGFFLNPTIDKLLVSSMESRTPGFDCKLQRGDEILQINTQAVPGHKARDIQTYWKSLKPNEAVTFKVLRDGKTLTLTLEE